MTADSNTAAILSLPWDANRDELLDVYLSARNDADDNNKFQYAEDADYYKFINELKLEDVKPGKTVSKRKIELFDATEIDSMRLENCKLKYIADSKTEQPLLSRRNSLLETTLHGDAYTKRIAPLSPQVIEKITTKEMHDLCKKYYGNFNGATFIIYSEYSPEYLNPILEKYLCLSLKKVDSKTMSYLCIKTAQKNAKSIMIQ